MGSKIPLRVLLAEAVNQVALVYGKEEALQYMHNGWRPILVPDEKLGDYFSSLDIWVLGWFSESWAGYSQEDK
ncbi:MAG: hypothetical protein ACOY9Y_02235 [Bacillota bacterium]